MLRLFIESAALAAGAALALPAAAARHVQVRRMQPGEPLIVYDGRGGEWLARVTAMTRTAVNVQIESYADASREPELQVTLAIGMPANERMDFLVEKATEIGAAALQPLHCARSVLRIEGDRAERKRAHWQALAVAASEQSGRTRVPAVAPVAALAPWLPGVERDAQRWLLSPRADAGLPPCDAARPLVVLSGPEGGLTAEEEAQAIAQGFVAVGLGPRVLRADTAPLALLARLLLP